VRAEDGLEWAAPPNRSSRNRQSIVWASFASGCLPERPIDFYRATIYGRVRNAGAGMSLAGFEAAMASIRPGTMERLVAWCEASRESPHTRTVKAMSVDEALALARSDDVAKAERRRCFVQWVNECFTASPAGRCVHCVSDLRATSA